MEIECLGVSLARAYIPAMTDSLYNEKILALAADLKKVDRLHDPDVSVTVSSALCGSRVKVDLVFGDGVVKDYGQEVRACALGQSSAALMKQIVVGSTPVSIRKAADQMRDMLAGKSGPPDGDWAGYAALLPARDHRSRHASVMLPFEGVVKAIGLLENAGEDKTVDHVG